MRQRPAVCCRWFACRLGSRETVELPKHALLKRSRTNLQWLCRDDLDFCKLLYWLWLCGFYCVNVRARQAAIVTGLGRELRFHWCERRSAR